MRKQFDYVRALLYVYPQADKLADAVRDGAKVRAYLSFKNPRDTLGIMESIAADMEYADRILFWKEQLERALAYCSEEELFLLEYKYFRRKSKLCGRSVTCSERSYFRKQQAVLERIARRLFRRGCTEEAFFRDFEGFSPFIAVLKAIGNGAERRVVERRKGRLSFGDQKSLSSEGAGDLRPRSTKKAIAATATTPKTSAAISRAESPEEGSASGSSSGAGATVSVR